MTTRSRIPAVGICMLGILLWARPPARADELPPGACAVKADYSRFLGLVQRMVNEQSPDLLGTSYNGVTIEISSVTATPVLGGLTYDPDGRPRRLEGTPTNNPTSSNDDYLRVRIAVKAMRGSMVLKTFHINVILAFPTDPPAGIDEQTSRSCQCREFAWEELTLVHVFNWCGVQSDTGHCADVSAFVRGVTSMVDGFSHPMRDTVNGQVPAPSPLGGDLWYRQMFNSITNGSIPPGTTFGNLTYGSSVTFPGGCDHLELRRCGDYILYRDYAKDENGDGRLDEGSWMFGYPDSSDDPFANRICQVCVRNHYDEEEVVLSPQSFPGPVAVDFWIEGNPEDICDVINDIEIGSMVMAFLGAIISFGVPELVGIPTPVIGASTTMAMRLMSCSIDMDDLLREAGLAEYDFRPRWWDAQYDPSRPLYYDVNVGAWSPEEHSARIEKTCCLQRLLNENLGDLFAGGLEVPGLGFLSNREVIRRSGGMRISDHKEALYLMIPPVWVSAQDAFDPVHGQVCSDPLPISFLNDLYPLDTGDDIKNNENLQLQGFLLDRNLDTPGLVQRSLAIDPRTEKYGIHVTCNHARDCSQCPVPSQAVDQNGDGLCDCEECHTTDTDGDGFCDDVDFCRDNVTGANCDTDGDGYGDSSPRILENCIVRQFAYDPSNPDPQPDALRGEELQRMINLFCGGCDSCPYQNNPYTHLGVDPGDTRSRQQDRDRDGIGDMCDEDADGDGVHREWDCDDLNPAISHDRDGDGVCDPLTQSPSTDPWARIPCYLACNENSLRYHDSSYDSLDCMDRCLTTDNAFNRGLEFCQHIEVCTRTQAAIGPEYCPSQYCRFVPGPGWPDTFVGNRCIPLQTNQCARAWANADQKDTDNDGVGDRMDPTPRVRDIFFGRGSTGLFVNSCSDHVVAFGTTGGETYANPTVVDQHGFQVPQFTKVYQDGVNVGACMCDLPLLGGEWHMRCQFAEHCPGTTETHLVGSQRVRTWNPINAPQTVDGLYTPNPSYPVAEGLTPGEVRTHVEDDALMYARKLGFSQDLGLGGSHQMDWHAHRSVEFTSWSPIDWPAQRDMDRTKIRVAWPPYSLIDTPSSSVVAFSQSGPTAGECGLLGARAGLLDLSPGTGPAPPRIPPEVVVSVIPGIAETELARDSVLRPRASRPGYFIGKDPLTGAISLNALGTETPRVVARWELQDDGLLDRPELLRGTAATLTAEIAGLQPSSPEAVFLYRPASPGDTGCDNLACTGYEPARFYVSTETAGEPMELVSGEDLWGQQSPDLFDARVIYAHKEHAALLIGRGGATTAVDQAWRLDLGTGIWEGPFTLGLPYPLSGYAFRYDPVSRKVLAFGGASVMNDAILSAEVHSICPRTLQTRRMATLDPPPAALLARASAGSYLDASERALYVFGGSWASGPVTHKDVWRLDLQSRQWSLVHETDLSEAPDPVVEPFLYLNRRQGTIWVGDLVGRNTVDGLRLHALDSQGVWHALPAIQLPEAQTWPVEAAYTPGSRPSYLWASPEGTSLPGALGLATLQAAQPFLGVTVYSGEAELLGESVAGPAGEQLAGFLCPVGDTCTLEVGLLPRGGSAAWLPFTLSVAPADLALESEHPQAGQIAGLALRNERLYVASAGRLQVYALGDLLDPRGHLGGSAVAAARAIVPCAGHLCLVRPGLRGLTVISLADPDHPKVAAKPHTAGLGWDVASVGRKVYVAHGLLGVGVYELSGEGQPTHQQTVSTGVIVRSVAARKGLLVAADPTGSVKLFRLGAAGEIQPAGELQARGRIDRARFLGGYLWVRGETGAWAEVWNVRDPAAPVLLGEVTGGGLALMEALFHGDRAFGFSDDSVQVYRVQPTL